MKKIDYTKTDNKGLRVVVVVTIGVVALVALVLALVILALVVLALVLVADHALLLVADLDKNNSDPY